MLEEFKKFISKGNVVDLAVGVIVGGAFSSIVTSLVNDVIMPLLGIIIGGIDFTGLVLKVGDAQIKYGAFIQKVINFLIVSFCIFMVVKFMNKLSTLKKKEEKKEEEKPVEKVSEEILLLREISASLKKKNK